jgi:hypothetical protein
MNKHRKLAKKLTLNTETLHALDDGDLAAIVGGQAQHASGSWIYCPSNNGNCPSAGGVCPSANGRCCG